MIDEDWLERAEKIADEQLGKPPRDALEKMLPVAIIAAIGGVVAGTVIGGDADFGGAWAGIIVGGGAYLYFANETRIYYRRRSEIIESYRPHEVNSNQSINSATQKTTSEKSAPVLATNETPEEVVFKACVVSRSLGASSPREAAEMTSGKALSDEQWLNHKEHWEDAWDEVLLNPDRMK